MTIPPEPPVEKADDLPDALEFLNTAGDDEVRWFLRRLPILAGNDGAPITLKDLIYEIRLLPFVMTAWDNTPGSIGIPGRLAQLSRVFKKSEREMKNLTGEKRRLPVIYVGGFIKRAYECEPSASWTV